MPDLHKALADIDAIRTQVARGTEFRGYGPATVALTGLLALLAWVLGIFASCRLLPKALFAVGAWYLASGLVCLAVGGNAWSPLAMGIPFGLGQLIMAAILHRALGGVDGED
jgi:hypothetical protein